MDCRVEPGKDEVFVSRTPKSLISSRLPPWPVARVKPGDDAAIHGAAPRAEIDRRWCQTT
jgi:hypothetical protein